MKDQIFLVYKEFFLELSKINGSAQKGATKRKRTKAHYPRSEFFHAGHAYQIKNTWKAQAICEHLTEHVVQEILRPSYFLDQLMGLFAPQVVARLTQQNIAIAILQKRVYAIRKLQNNQWLGVEILSQKQLGDSVILDGHGNILKKIQRSKEHQKRINRRRRVDTKIIAAFNP